MGMSSPSRDTVSIIGVVLIDYNGGNGHGESYQGGWVLSRMRWEEELERDLGHSVFPEAQPGEKRGSPHQCTLGIGGLHWWPLATGPGFNSSAFLWTHPVDAALFLMNEGNDSSQHNQAGCWKLRLTKTHYHFPCSVLHRGVDLCMLHSPAPLSLCPTVFSLWEALLEHWVGCRGREKQEYFSLSLLPL